MRLHLSLVPQLLYAEPSVDVIQGFDIMQDVSEPAYIHLPQML